MTITNDFGAIDKAEAGTSTDAVMDLKNGPPFEGYFQTKDDVDWVAVTLEAGKFYDIILSDYGADDQGEYVDIDALLQVYDAQGQLLLSPLGGDNRFLFSPEATGKYYLEASLLKGAVSNGYTMFAFEVPPPSMEDAIDWGTAVADKTVTVCFAAAGTEVLGDASLGWSPYERQQAMLALQQISNICDVSFQVTNDAATADFLVGTKPGDSPLGQMYPPEEGVAQAQGQFFVAGDGWDEAGGGGLEQGGYGFETLLHEFGHGMGLAHPHDNGGSSSIWQGVTKDFGSYGALNLNQGVYTVMSYNSGWELNPDGQSASFNFGYDGTMMAWDIAVLQEKYGANTSFHDGNDIYRLRDGNLSGTYYSCIWDTGGKDAIAYTGNRDAIIDLRAATLAYDEGSGGYISYAREVTGGFTIANGVTIENATGDRGDDILTGNGLKNRLDGNAGADQLIGGLGGDRLAGGRGADTFIYESAFDSRSAGRGDVIADFRTTVDTISLLQIDASTRGSDNDTFIWIDTDAFSGAKGELRWEDTADGALIEADRNGDATADFAILLRDSHTVLQSDIVL